MPRSVTQRAQSAGTILERKLQRAFGKAPSEGLSGRELQLLGQLHTALACGACDAPSLSQGLSELWHECQSELTL